MERDNQTNRPGTDLFGSGETQFELEEIIKGVKFTFSRWCRSGLLERCECWRCRKQRGEEVTPETDKLSEEQAKVADVKYQKKIQEFLLAHHLL